MKKKILFIFVLVICISVFVCNHIKEEPIYRPFEFRGGIRYSGGGYVRSTSHVLINEKTYNVNELYQSIYDEFTLMNGIHDEITFYLYDSLEDLHASNSFSERTFIKDP